MKRIKLKYREGFSEAMLDLKLLIEAHFELLTSELQKDFTEDQDTVFLRSAYLLLSADWEKFIEEIIISGAKFMVDNITIENIPRSLKKQISHCIKRDKNELSPWALAEKGWKSKIIDYVEK